jgi:hypothetical protein
VSGNNSFIEGGQELMLPPAMGRGAQQKTFFGFG